MVEREEPGKVDGRGFFFVEECPSVETSDPMDHCTPPETTQGDKISD